MGDVFVLNYSENTYQKERVRKAVEGLGAKILNRFSKRPLSKNNYGHKREDTRLLLENDDFDLMKSAQEIWIISSKAWFGFLRKGEQAVKKFGKPLRYFSICHSGPYVGQMKEVKRSYLEEKVDENNR